MTFRQPERLPYKQIFHGRFSGPSIFSCKTTQNADTRCKLGFVRQLEIINGIGHPFWTLRERGYTPGVATAPMLLVLALSLMWQLKKSRSESSPPQGNA
jgi:hypothetical protein